MRQRFILVKRADGGGDLVPANEHAARATGTVIVRDYGKPFLSMADGKTVITSRSQYAEHLKRHGCEIVGNDTSAASKSKPAPVAPILKDIWNNRSSPDALRNIRESGRIRD